jgi:hypothetical protein
MTKDRWPMFSNVDVLNLSPDNFSDNLEGVMKCGTPWRLKGMFQHGSINPCQPHKGED